MKRCSWKALALSALGLVSLCGAPSVSPLCDAAMAQSQPPITWIEQTWVVAETQTPGTWYLMLSMVYDKEGSVILPVGTIHGNRTTLFTNNNPPGGEYYGYTRTSIVTSDIQGTLVVDPELVSDLALDATYEGSLITSRWNYTSPTAGGAYMEVASTVGSKLEPLLAQIRVHYETTVQPALLGEYDPEFTSLSDAHDTPGRVKKKGGGTAWRIVIPIAPIILDKLWDTIRDAVTPAPAVPPPATPAQQPVPTNEQNIANCKAAVQRAADFHSGQCASSACPPAWRTNCTQCVAVQRDMQFINCDNNSAIDGSAMLGCTTVACD
jgi:hypothetical protein